jgi:succinylglutamate desuccinylase
MKMKPQFSGHVYTLCPKNENENTNTHWRWMGRGVNEMVQNYIYFFGHVYTLCPKNGNENTNICCNDLI